MPVRTHKKGKHKGKKYPIHKKGGRMPHREKSVYSRPKESEKFGHGMGGKEGESLLS